MKAAVVEAFGKPLVLREWTTATPRAGQITVKTEAYVVRHTDLHAPRGDWPFKPTPPFTPDHECIGLLAAVGAGVINFKEGDRVGVPWLYSACGYCEYSRSGWETVCAGAQCGGYTVNRGFAKYILADPDYVAGMPSRLTVVYAAPIVCAGVTAYKGVKGAATKQGDWLVISGTGDLNNLAVQHIKAMGLFVCAVGIADGKLAHPTLIGADVTVDATLPDALEQVKKATHGGAQDTLITAPSLAAFKKGVAMTRKRGTCILIGLWAGEFPFLQFDVVMRCITVRGSLVGTRHGRSTGFCRWWQGKSRYRNVTFVRKQLCARQARTWWNFRAPSYSVLIINFYFAT